MFGPLHIPHRFTHAHTPGVMLVALTAMLACGSVWSQAPAGASPGSAFTPVSPAIPAAPTTSATPAPIDSGDASPMGTYPGSPAGAVAPASLAPTLSNPINRNPATRAAIAAPPVSAGSTKLATPSTQGFSSPPASRDTLAAPVPSRDGMPGTL